MLPETIEQAFAVLNHGTFTANDLLEPSTLDIQELKSSAEHAFESGEVLFFCSILVFFFFFWFFFEIFLKN